MNYFRYCHGLSFAVGFLYLVFFRTTEYFNIPYPTGHTNMIQMILTLKVCLINYVMLFEKNSVNYNTFVASWFGFRSAWQYYYRAKNETKWWKDIRSGALQIVPKTECFRCVPLFVLLCWCFDRFVHETLGISPRSQPTDK